MTSASRKRARNVVLDAEVWGKLQEHFPLHAIYSKLPHQELFRLRTVCKAWNRAALQRLEPEPYFVTLQMGEDNRFLDGILSYDAPSAKFGYQRLQHFPLRGYTGLPGIAPVESEGLIFCHRPDHHGVFDVHTRTWHAIPPPPEAASPRLNLVYGLVVDTSERPYSFKLIVGSCESKTQAYDSRSRSWTQLSSRLMPSAKPALADCQYLTCVCSEGWLYISLGVKLLLMYSIDRDAWTSQEFPPVEDPQSPCPTPDEVLTHAVGAWGGRIFTSREDEAELKVVVWELVDRCRWVEYASTSEEVYELLLDNAAGAHVLLDMTIVPQFGSGHLLVYNWQLIPGCVRACIVMDLATKEWKHADDLPYWKMDIECDSETEREHGEYNYSSEFEDSDEVDDQEDYEEGDEEDFC